MTCEENQIRLLTSDDPSAAPAGGEADIAAHLSSCAACRELLERLNRVEAAVRALPEPTVAASASCVAFLKRLEQLDSTAAFATTGRASAIRMRRWSAYRLVPRVAAAAAVLLLLISGVWVLTGDVPSADASSAVVGQLVEWNVNLAQAASPEERDEIFASAVGPFKQRIATLKMPEDQELARKLLDMGQAMAGNEDPIDDVERLNDTADLLLKRIQLATGRKNMRAVRIYCYNYALLRATAGGTHLQKLEPPPGENPQRFERLEKMIRHDGELRKRLQRLLEQSPAATKQEIIKALDLPKPPQRKAMTRPTTRSGRPNRAGPREDRARRDGAKPPTAPSPEQQQREQQMRERRVRDWFRDFKKREKPGDTATTVPSLNMPSLGLQSD